MRYWLIAATIVAVPAPAMAQLEQDAHVWLSVKASGSVSGPILASAELLARESRNQHGVYETQVTGLIGYKASSHLTLWTGYTRSTLYRPRASVEDRIRQQAVFTWPGVAGGTLSSRTQMEQRFFQGADDIGWRFRQQLRYAHPLRTGSATDIVVSHESQIALNTSTGQHIGYQRARHFAGLNTPLGKQLRTEFGYLNQYEARHAAPDRMAHIAALTFNYGF